MAFTRTKLLVVTVIIVVVTGLLAVAAYYAWNSPPSQDTLESQQVTLEIQQISRALDKLKNEFGAYPPNVYPNNDPTVGLSDTEKMTNISDLRSFLEQVSSSSTELQIGSEPANDNLTPLANYGLTPAEAIVFWLQGFSTDNRRPLSGTDLEGILVDSNTMVTIDCFLEARYKFDRSRLLPSKDASGRNRRLSLSRADGGQFLVQLYEYLPPGTEEPYTYFDTSRRTPHQAITAFPTGEFFFKSSSSSELVFAQKELLDNAPAVPALREHIVYVNQGRFQILHCGRDDAWGDFSATRVTDDTTIPSLLFPEGPFVGGTADTVGNFITATLGEDRK